MENNFSTMLIVRYVGMIVHDLFPGSLGLPRWRTSQIPVSGAATKSNSLLGGRLSESNSRG